MGPQSFDDAFDSTRETRWEREIEVRDYGYLFGERLVILEWHTNPLHDGSRSRTCEDKLATPVEVN